MQKSVWFLVPLSFVFSFSMAQKVTGRLQFEQGKTLTVTMDLKSTVAQQAGGQAIDFTTTGSALHSFRVTNTTDDNTTLHHTLQRIAFAFDGMGQKVGYDTDHKSKKGDRQDMFSKPFEEMLGKKYDIVIDPTGKTLRAIPEKIELSGQDERAKIITNMLKDLTGIVYPPAKGSPSFFSVLPEGEIGTGDSWTTQTNTDTEKGTTVSTVSVITDSTIVVDFKTDAVLNLRSEMMGMETKTSLKNITTGKIILDRKTGLIRERSSVTDSNGNTEAMGATLPLTGKTTITIRVRQD